MTACAKNKTASAKAVLFFSVISYNEVINLSVKEVRTMKKKLFAGILSAVLLCGCGSRTQTAAELPEDTPYNRLIMETENGYYTNTGHGMFLRFYERDTENQIFLCAKPECLHDGSETCVATYKNLETINTVLYDGALYILALENGDTVKLSLYKAALDGTSLTKVGDVFTVANSAGEETVEALGGLYFIIHKGYAYIPYHITLGYGSLGFAGGGLVKMNISDGSTEQLYSGEDYFSAYPYSLQGSGDYVWFTMRGYNYDPKAEPGIYLYNAETGELKKIMDGDLSITVSDTRIYARGISENSGEDRQLAIYCHDKKNIENGGDLSVNATPFAEGFGNKINTIIAYKDMVIAGCRGEISIYNEDGEKLGEFICYDSETDSMFSDDANIAVSNCKIYLMDYYLNRTGKFYNDKYFRVIYSCPIEDIISGTGEWKFEYGIIDEYRIRNEELFNNNAEN